MGVDTFLWTLALFVAIQQLEGAVIAPLVTQRMVHEIQQITQGAVSSMDTSVHLVQEGIAQADVVNVTIQKIKSDSDKVSEAIAAIAISMKEQSNVSVEISRNVERVAQMTEENTAAAQQNTQVATHLSSVSQSMMDAVKVFKTE